MERELATFRIREVRPLLEDWNVVRTPLLERNTSIVRGWRFYEPWIFSKTCLGMDNTSLPGRSRGRDTT